MVCDLALLLLLLLMSLGDSHVDGDLVCFFQLLGLEESLDVWGTFHFGIHLIVIGLYLVCQVIPTKKVCPVSR